MSVREDIIGKLVRSGDLLANCAFNLKQKASSGLTSRDRDVLDECQREWDRLRAELRDYDNLLKAPAPPPVKREAL